MICKNCGSMDFETRRTMPISNNTEIRRYKRCLNCGFTFTTIEKQTENELYRIETRAKELSRESD